LVAALVSGWYVHLVITIQPIMRESAAVVAGAVFAGSGEPLEGDVVVGSGGHDWWGYGWYFSRYTIPHAKACQQSPLI
jgi:hypothetical protein